MTTNRSRRRKGPKERSLDALAFYHGAHGIDPGHVVHEIEAKLNREASEEKQEPLRKLHALEAKLQQARKERPEAEASWQRVRKELGDTPPPYFHAVVMAVFAGCALVLDTLFLAPTMDILSIANPTLQYIAAGGVAALSTSVFEISGRHYINARNATEKRNAMIVAGLGVFALVVWGLLRGREIQFAAGLAGNPLGSFLADHPILASIFFIFITLATPIVGAVALLYGGQEFSAAKIWRRVRDRFETIRTAEVELARRVQAETQHIEEFDKRKAEECREWKAVYACYYERGQRNGARQETKASVIRKTALGTLCALPVALLIPLAFFPAQLGVLAVAGLACFIYFNHRRQHPSPERFLQQENTRFAVVPDAPQPKAFATTNPYLLSKGDPECTRPESPELYP
jgi:hypothetical protein